MSLYDYANADDKEEYLKTCILKINELTISASITGILPLVPFLSENNVKLLNTRYKFYISSKTYSSLLENENYRIHTENTIDTIPELMGINELQTRNFNLIYNKIKNYHLKRNENDYIITLIRDSQKYTYCMVNTLFEILSHYNNEAYNLDDVYEMLEVCVRNIDNFNFTKITKAYAHNIKSYSVISKALEIIITFADVRPSKSDIVHLNSISNDAVLEPERFFIDS